jgi:hypothetical protein
MTDKTRSARLVLRPTLTDILCTAACLAVLISMGVAAITADAHYQREALICQEGC